MLQHPWLRSGYRAAPASHETPPKQQLPFLPTCIWPRSQPNQPALVWNATILLSSLSLSLSRSLFPEPLLGLLRIRPLIPPLSPSLFLPSSVLLTSSPILPPFIPFLPLPPLCLTVQVAHALFQVVCRCSDARLTACQQTPSSPHSPRSAL
jgi:hypothetical protein